MNLVPAVITTKLGRKALTSTEDLLQMFFLELALWAL
jgi:hypothetical protein